jgi:CheY-like chemotaxis protein
MCQLVASRVRVLLVEDEPYMAGAIRDGLRLEAIAAAIAGDGDEALELLSVNAYDTAVPAAARLARVESEIARVPALRSRQANAASATKRMSDEPRKPRGAD